MNRSLAGVDVGGTFTDCVSYVDGKLTVLKVPTTTGREHDGVVEGLSRLSPENIGTFNHASTVGINSVITRRLPKIAYLGTEGHRDVPDMGRAWRPFDSLTDPTWRRAFSDVAKPLVRRYLRRGIRERITARGEVLIPLDVDQAREQLEIVKKCDVQGVAICLINSYMNADHEIRLRELVAEVLGDDVLCSLSSDVSPLAKEYARASTTIVDVLMKSIYGRYSQQLLRGLEERGFAGRVNFADCSASLIPVEHALDHPFKVVFSGPAAGTRSSAYFGQQIGEANLICADVGGTSTDYSVVQGGEPITAITFELEHDLVVNTLSNEIVSIGAGGGSLVSVASGGELQVGPDSAGAEPGPACYGRGGTRPTMTDACLLAGVLSADGLLGGSMRLDEVAARKSFEALETPLEYGERIKHAYWLGIHHISEGILKLASKYGLEPRDFSVVAYGSAGPMLVPAALDVVGVKSVLVPPNPGLFSAMGLLSADEVYTDSRSSYVFLGPDTADEVNGIYTQMEEDLLARAGAKREDVVLARSFDGRLLGQTWETPFVTAPDGDITAGAVTTMVENFHTAYQRRWGNRFEELPVQAVTYRAQLIVPTDKMRYEPADPASGSPSPVSRRTLSYIYSEPVEAPVYERAQLGVGTVVDGPAIIREEMSTTNVGPRHRARVGAFGEIVITTRESASGADQGK